MRSLRVGSRGSALARRQAEIATEALSSRHPELDLVTAVLQTEGDRRQDASLDRIGGQGVFVKDIEARLLAGEVDLAVHSLKDMPPETPPALTIAAYLPRGDARDALIGREGMTLADLPRGARIGSDSRRRAVQLLAIRPDIEMAGIRGNVDTRVRKVDAGEYDAVVLAFAGLERLGLGHRASQVFGVTELLPAVGQGVLAVQCRTDDNELRELLSDIDDTGARLAVEAERSFLATLGAGCSLPVAAHATIAAESLRLEAMLADSNGKAHRARAGGPAVAGQRLGVALAQRLRMEAGV